MEGYPLVESLGVESGSREAPLVNFQVENLRVHYC